MSKHIATYGEDFRNLLKGLRSANQQPAPGGTFEAHTALSGSSSTIGILAASRTRDDPITTLSARVGHMAASGSGVTSRDLERYLGRNDLLRINYLERGLMATHTVCRLRVPAAFGGGGEWGTGFLVSPRLLLTNNHVIATPEDAQRAMAEFGYESNARGILQQGVRFLFAPQAAFITDPDLDFTLVALNESSEDGRAMLSNYGFLRLDPGLHKVDEYEFVTIIQHPNGDEKYIAIRENKVIKIGDKVDVERDNLLWYASDTAQGSSGAPVLNDSWQVVALHSRGVPETRENNGATEYQLVTGEWVPKEDAEQLPDDRLKWIANEGIRISRIIARIAEKHTAQGSVQSPLVHDLLDDAGGVRTFAGTLPKESVVGPTTILPPVALPQVTPQVTLEDMAFERGISKYIRELNYYDGREGYDPEFLGVNIALPEITPVALRFGSPAPVEGTDDGVLRYTHFSVVFNQQRKLAFFTAVNIDGERWRSLNRGVDKWYYDPRIQIDLQVGDELYGGEPGSLGQKGWFDRGHLVRRLDPVWGSLETATLADNDTFHWTNCSPQYWAFNQGSEFWQGLENYILYNSEEENVRATVFTGPVFQENDEVHRGVQIPQYFWKVVVVRDGAGWLYSSAYVVGQAQYATNITFEELPIRNFNNFQVSLSHLEEQTGLRFPDNVREADVLGPNAEDRPLRSLGDIVHPRRPGKKSPPPGTPVPQPPTREGPLAAQSQASSNPL